MAQEPGQPAAKAGQRVEQLGVHRLDGEQRDETDHRAHADVRVAAVRHSQQVVVELVVVAPQIVDVVAERAGTVIDRVGNVEEVLEELRGHVFVRAVVARELERDCQHVEAEHGHPAGSIALVEPRPAGERVVPIEHADVVQAEEAALEDIAAVRVLAVHPPGEVDEQFVKHPLEELGIADSRRAPLDLVHAHRRPCVDRRVHVAERPLVRRQLAVGMHEPLAQQQHELLLGELGIDHRQRNRVKGEIPPRVPRILPGVGHRDHVVVVEVRPRVIAPGPALRRRRRKAGVAEQPLVHVVMVKLLTPEQPREGLALHEAFVVRDFGGRQGLVELVRFGATLGEQVVERRTERRRAADERRQPQANHLLAAGGDREAVAGGALRPLARGIHSVRASMDHVLMKRVLDVGLRVRHTEHLLRVGVVVREQQLRMRLTCHVVAAERLVRGQDLHRSVLSSPAPTPTARSRARPTSTCRETRASAGGRGRRRPVRGSRP